MVTPSRESSDGLVAQGVKVVEPSTERKEKKGRGRGQRPKVRLAANFGGNSLME